MSMRFHTGFCPSTDQEVVMKFGTQLKISSVIVLMSVLLTSLGAGAEVRTAQALCRKQDVAEGCIVRLPRRLTPTTIGRSSGQIAGVVNKATVTATATPVRPHHLHDVSND
jgi:hypothetical protein